MHPRSVSECRELLHGASADDLPALIATFSADERAGVRTACEAARRRLARIHAEDERLRSLGALERTLRERGYRIVAGIDEVGRGALAGPLSVAAVVLPPDARIDGLDDSKRLSPERRETVAASVREQAVCWQVAHVTAAEIDALGMTRALRTAMTRALEILDPAADHVVVDGLAIGLGLPETAVVGGDRKVAAIAAASVLAKVTRDSLMREFDVTYPGYGFAANKGYGTEDHVSAIARLGLTAIHRRSFAPCGDTPRLF